VNIFYYDNKPEVCARMHCDRHVVKMLIEYAQLLSTAHRLLDGIESIEVNTINGKPRKKKVWAHPNPTKQAVLYKATHVNHPSAKWARHSNGNYSWLFNLWSRLCEEYEYRYGKVHATKTKLWDLLINCPENIPLGKFTQPWRAMPDQYKMPKTMANYCELSYQSYFNGEKQHIANWKNREAPHWFKSEKRNDV